MKKEINMLAISFCESFVYICEMDQQQIEFILDALKEPPFSKQLTILQLQHDLPFYEIMNLVGLVILAIDPSARYKLNIKQDADEIVISKLLDFLVICRFPHDQ